MLGLPVLLVLGVVTGLADVLVYRHELLVGGPDGFLLPWGFCLALAATYGLFACAGRLFDSSGVLAAALGWLLVIVVCLFPRVDGDILVPEDWLGLGLLFGGVVLTAVAFGRALTRATPVRPGYGR